MVYDPAWDMPQDNWAPQSSYELPVHPPLVAPDGGTPVCIGPLAQEWVPYILGAMDQLRNPATWIAPDDAALFTILAEVTRLKQIVSLADACNPPSSSGLIVAMLLNYRATTDIANGLSSPAETWTNLDTAKTFTVVDNASTAVQIAVGGNVLMGNVDLLNECSMRFVIDGTDIHVISGSWATNDFMNAVSGSSLVVIPDMAVGDHTIQVQMRAIRTSACYCRCASNPDYESFYITIQQLIAGASGGGGTDFRLTDGGSFGEDGQGQLQYSIDGGVHWITVPGWNSNICSVVKHCIPNIGIPDNPGGLPPDQLSCAIAQYLADQIIKLSFQKASQALTDNLILLDFGALVLTLIPEFVLVAAFYDAVTFIYNVIAISDRSAFSDAETNNELWLDVTCAIYNAIVADGHVTAGNFGAILTNLAAVSYSHPAVVTAIVGFVDHIGATGLAQLSQRAGLNVGAECLCGHWCYKWAPGAADLCGGDWVVPEGGFGTCGFNQWHSVDIGGSFQLNLEAVFADAYPIDGITIEGVWSGTTHLIAYDGDGTVVLDQDSLSWSGDLLTIKHIALVIDGPDSATIDAITLHGRGSNPFGDDNCDVSGWCRRYDFSVAQYDMGAVDGFWTGDRFTSSVAESKYGGGGTEDGLIIETSPSGQAFGGGAMTVTSIRVKGVTSGTSDGPDNVHFGRGIFVGETLVASLPNTVGPFDVTVDVSGGPQGSGYNVSVCNSPTALSPNTVTLIQARGEGTPPIDGVSC